MHQTIFSGLNQILKEFTSDKANQSLMDWA